MDRSNGKRSRLEWQDLGGIVGAMAWGRLSPGTEVSGEDEALENGNAKEGSAGKSPRGRFWEGSWAGRRLEEAELLSLKKGPL